MSESDSSVSELRNELSDDWAFECVSDLSTAIAGGGGGDGDAAGEEGPASSSLKFSQNIDFYMSLWLISISDFWSFN